MRKAQKQEVLEFIQSLYQAHEEIKEALNQNNRISAQNMLAECQEFAASLGESIERLEGEGHATVTCVEGYCEMLFRAYEELSSDIYNESKIYKKLRKQLLKVENSAKNDIAVRKEVVFLPYKASMWDSLESVWKAADADEQSDAFVVPIPYYDKNPDGSFREIHYEGNQYPEYVPITSYEDYDFKTRRPDIIYIHNPYDNMNLVTSVHPFFFSDNLKKFTNELVYIPYFVLDEIRPDEDEKIKYMKHFCTVPGVFNADKVIVQSENMKQVYIKVLLDETNDHTEAARTYWEEKILGLGSPKFDKVINTRKEDLDIPQEWLKVIKKPDGSWKKIILYNTSVGALLQNSEQMLKKMEYVFNIFQENKEEVALLWRPHPLIKATVESMRPQLWKEYDQIVKKYQEEDWGIYDDTADVDRAIEISDAYYGDSSSVVQLYQKTGKLIMIQDVEILKKDIEFPWNSRIVDIDDKGLFVGSGFDALFQLNFSLNELNCVCGLSNKNIINFRNNTFPIKYKEKIFIFPDLGKYILIFEKETLNNIPIKSDNKRVGIINAYIQGESIFFISKGLSKIIELDAEHNKISNEYLITFCNENVDIGWECIEEEGKIYCVSSKNSLVVVFNMHIRKMEYIPIPIKCMGFTTICKKGNFFYFSGKDKFICKWNSFTNEVQTLLNFPENFGVYTSMNEEVCLDSNSTKFTEPLFISSIVIENKIYFIPYQSNYILTVDATNDAIKMLYIPNEEENAVSWRRNMRHKYLLEYVKNKRYLWLYSFKQKRIVEVDLKTEQVKYLKFNYSEQSTKKIHQLLLSQKEAIMYENEICSLAVLMEDDFIYG